LTARREVQRKAEIGEEIETEPAEIEPAEEKRPIVRAPTAQDDLQKKILEILNKKPLMQQIAKKVEVKPKSMTQVEKDELKNKLMKDDKIKQAMIALRNTKNK
jgi:IS30 family transposase